MRRSWCSATSNEKFSRGSQMQHYLCFEAPSLQGSLLHYHWTTAHSRSRLSYIHWTPPELSLCGSHTLCHPSETSVYLHGVGLSTAPSHGGAAKAWLHDIRDNVSTVNESRCLLFPDTMYPSHAHSHNKYFPLLEVKIQAETKSICHHFFYIISCFEKQTWIGNNSTAELWNHFLFDRITIKCYVNDKHYFNL